MGREETGGAFSRTASLQLKGIAIMLMMLHHNFWDKSLYERYTVSFFPFNEQQVVNVALSVVIEAVKKVLKYDQWVNKLA